MLFLYFLHPYFQKNGLFVLFISLERLKKWLSIVVYINYIHVKKYKIDVTFVQPLLNTPYPLLSILK